MPSLTLLIIYYSQSPEDNGENLETWVGSSPICSSKASNKIKKQGTLSGAPTKKKNLNPRARFFTGRQQKFQGLGFLPS